MVFSIANESQYMVLDMESIVATSIRLADQWPEVGQNKNQHQKDDQTER
jgi:hypothetical protein